MFEEDQSVFIAMRTGLQVYVLKGAKHDKMLRAIRAVTSGEAMLPPPLAHRRSLVEIALRPAGV